MLKSHDLALIGISGPNRLFISIYIGLDPRAGRMIEPNPML